tara:strand:+ start:7394 stop:7813 length:420 start_codon:yes stop_codon:yes gene_type:complete
MRGVSYWFFLSATLYVLAGMVFGMAMAASGDHSLSSAHAHLNLVGWVTMGLFAVFYHCCPDIAQGRLAKVHFGVATLGLWTTVPGIALATLGRGEGLAIAGSLTTLLSMALFADMVIRVGTTRRPAAGVAAIGGPIRPR